VRGAGLFCLVFIGWLFAFPSAASAQDPLPSWNDGAAKQQVTAWLQTAKDAHWKRPYTDLVYQPMLEVMRLLGANGYKTYLVTGGGQDFVRVYSEKVYGIPPEQVVGSAGVTPLVMTQAASPCSPKSRSSSSTTTRLANPRVSIS